LIARAPGRGLKQGTTGRGRGHTHRL
jgi:hypothetical protein